MMFKETGRVLEYNNGVVKIVVDPRPVCHSCQICKRDKSDMLMETATDLKLSPGQLVDLEITGRNFLLVSFILYIVPVIDLIIGMIFGMFLSKLLFYEKYQNEFELFFGLIFFSTSYFLARWLDKRLKNKSIVEIKLIS